MVIVKSRAITLTAAHFISTMNDLSTMDAIDYVLVIMYTNIHICATSGKQHYHYQYILNLKQLQFINLNVFKLLRMRRCIMELTQYQI